MALTCLQSGVWVGSSHGQAPGFNGVPDFYQIQPSQPAMFQGGVLPANSGGSGFYTNPAQSGLSMPPPPSQFMPSGLPQGTMVDPNTGQLVQGQVFDPYSVQTSPLPTLPSQSYPSSQGFNAPPPRSFGQPYNSPGVMQPDLGSGYVFGPNATPWTLGQGAGFGLDSGIQNQRGVISPAAWPGQLWSRYGKEPMPRLLDHPRARHTWISGNNGHELSLNEIEVAATMLIPNFMWSNQPFLLSPGFIFSMWDGPDTAITGFDMPARTYSIYVNIDTMTDSRRDFGLESSLTVGYYSDFVNWSSNGLRVSGTALGWARLNPYTTFKIGAEYYDRVRLKMLPAFGIFMEPTSDLKIDLFFPRPRLSHRLPKFGNFDVWGYVAAEYGGGSWVIERMGGMNDQVDVNEVRAYFGFEWLGPKGVTGFAETGYVFDREMLYRSDPLNRLQVQDAMMVRLGFAF